MAVDGTHVYWANNASGTIGRANLDGSNPNQSFITGANAPIGVAVDGAHVYWTNFPQSAGTGIGRANLDGSMPTRASSPAAPSGWRSTLFRRPLQARPSPPSSASAG